MTTYYTPSGNPPSATRGQSQQLRDEFTSISAGFSSVNTDITAKETEIQARALKAGDTYTGTHNFSGATAVKAPTPATSDNSANVATTAQVQAAIAAYAMSASTPTTPSDKDKVWTSTGSIGHWASTGLFPLVSAITPSAAAAVNALTLFSSSYDNIVIKGSGILPATNDTLRLRVAVGGAADSGSNYYNSSTIGSSAGGAFTTATTSFAVAADLAAAAGKGMDFEIRLLNVNDPVNMKAFMVWGVREDAATPSFQQDIQSGAYIAASALTGFTLFWSGGANFAATGKIRVYGYSN